MTQQQADNLTNEGMIDMMYHQYTRAQSATPHINVLAFWQKWIRG